MIRTVFFLLLALTASHVFSRAADEQDAAWIPDDYNGMETMIPMWDGLRLFATIYMPKEASRKHPVHKFVFNIEEVSKLEE